MEPTPQHPNSFPDTSIIQSPTNKVCHRDSFSSMDTKASAEFHNLLNQLDQLVPDPTQMVISQFFTLKKISYKDIPDFNIKHLSKSKSKTPFQGWFINQPINREILVTWLDQICLKFRLSNRSISLAMLILDKVSVLYNDEEYETRVMMLLCLSIATKMLETPDKCLSLFSICEFFLFKYSMDTIIEMECCVFAAIDFNASGYTTLDFLLYFMSQGIFSQQELDTLPGIKSAAFKLRSQELQLLNMCFETLKHPFLNAFTPSIVAASLIFIIRNILGFLTWTRSHQLLTGHSFNDICECASLLLDVDIDVYRNAVSLSVNNTMCWQYTLSINALDSDSFICSESDDFLSLDQSLGHDGNPNDDTLFDVFVDIYNPAKQLTEPRETREFEDFKDNARSIEGLPSMKRVKY